MSVRAFKASLQQWKAQLPDRLEVLVRNVAFVLAENIVVGGTYGPGSPVDTGFFRASWQLVLGQPALSEALVNPRKGNIPAPDLSAFATALTDIKLGDVVTIFNDCVYGEELEYGHSQQAPNGMVRVVLANAQQIVDDCAKRLLTGELS